MTKQREAEQYSEQETDRRRDEIVRRMLNTPPKPHATRPNAAKEAGLRSQ
jgi:hypothetical protein